MSVLQRFFGSNDQPDGLTVLENLLAERQATLALEAEYGRPTVNMQGEPTAVFPISLFHEGEEYGAHAKEFAVPDNGLDDEDAPLTRFLAVATDQDPSEVTMEDLTAVEGMTAGAALCENGDITVDNPTGDN